MTEEFWLLVQFLPIDLFLREDDENVCSQVRPLRVLGMVIYDYPGDASSLHQHIERKSFPSPTEWRHQKMGSSQEFPANTACAFVCKRIGRLGSQWSHRGWMLPSGERAVVRVGCDGGCRNNYLSIGGLSGQCPGGSRNLVPVRHQLSVLPGTLCKGHI